MKGSRKSDWMSLTNMVDGLGTTRYSCVGAGQFLTEDGPFDSDTVAGYPNPNFL